MYRKEFVNKHKIHFIVIVLSRNYFYHFDYQDDYMF